MTVFCVFCKKHIIVSKNRFQPKKQSWNRKELLSCFKVLQLKKSSYIFFLFFYFPKWIMYLFNHLSANFIKWSNTLKQFVCRLHFVGLVLKRDELWFFQVCLLKIWKVRKTEYNTICNVFTEVLLITSTKLNTLRF